MHHKKKIVALLAGLIAWNGVLGGVSGILMCLHAAGSFHIASFETTENCCHVQEDDAIHECQKCNDLELDGIDLLAFRDSDSTLTYPIAKTSEVFVLSVPTWKKLTILGPNPTRAPPYRVDTCLMVAETVVLRI